MFWALDESFEIIGRFLLSFGQFFGCSHKQVVSRKTFNGVISPILAYSILPFDREDFLNRFTSQQPSWVCCRSLGDPFSLPV